MQTNKSSVNRFIIFLRELRGNDIYIKEKKIGENKSGHGILFMH